MCVSLSLFQLQLSGIIFTLTDINDYRTMLNDKFNRPRPCRWGLVSSRREGRGEEKEEEGETERGWGKNRQESR